MTATVVDDVLMTELGLFSLLFLLSLVFLAFPLFVSISDSSLACTSFGGTIIRCGRTTCILRACRHWSSVWVCCSPDFGVNMDTMKGRLRIKACLVTLSRSLVRRSCFWTSCSSAVGLEETSWLAHDPSVTNVSRSPSMPASSRCTPCKPTMPIFIPDRADDKMMKHIISSRHV